MRKQKGVYTKPRNVSEFGNYAYTLAVSLICWIVGYYFSVGYPVYQEVAAPPLWNEICRILPGKNITYLLGLMFLIGGAFLLQRANYILILIREKTFLPFVLYILLISTNPDFFPLKSTSVGIFCLIMAMYQLFVSYHNPASRANAYNAALFIGGASLLWVHILWFFPLFWYGMYIFKSFNLGTLMASLLGVVTIYWILFCWCVWQEDFTYFSIPFATLTKIHLFLHTGTNVTDWLGILLVAILTTISAIQILVHQHEESLRTRQYLGFLILFAIVSFVLFFVYEQSSEEFLVTACVPASILLAHLFTMNKGKMIVIVYHIFVILLLILLIVRLWSFLSIMVI